MTTVVPARAPGSAASITPDYILGTPLPRLLSELAVEVIESPIGEDDFCGHAEVRGGRITLSVSSQWSEIVRDGMSRALLAVALRVPRPPLPEPFTVTEL